MIFLAQNIVYDDPDLAEKLLGLSDEVHKRVIAGMYGEDVRSRIEAARKAK